MNAGKLNLPKTVGLWTGPDAPRIIHSKNIFNYMNGAGELYLAYRFDHLEVYDFTADNRNNILVELYFMKTSDDAFGLLSLDWGGDPVSVDRPSTATTNDHFTAPARALYGGGLLRLWSDNIYARVMVDRESPTSKEAVLFIGRAILSDIQNPPEPKLVKKLPLKIDAVWKLRSDRLSFFRSHLVLNSIYYLSHENILDLDHSTEAVIVPYENRSKPGDTKRVQLLIGQYENPGNARQALNHFHDAYLPEYKKKITADSATSSPSPFKLEDGWLAYQLLGNCIAIVFECPDEESARAIIEKIEPNLLNNGGDHGG